METNPQSDYQKKALAMQRNIFLVLTILLAGLCAFLIWKVANQETQIETVTIEKQAVSTEKADLITKLEAMKKEYEDMSKQYSNLDSVFTKEKERIENMLKEVKGLKGSVANYKNLVSQLETRQKEYLQQIEELKSKNQELTVENIKVKTDLDSSSLKNTRLASQNEDLSAKVQTGSILKAYNLNAKGFRYKKNGKELEELKAKKVQKIKTCLTLSENPLAKAGMKDVFVRIASPDGAILHEGDDDTFNLDGKGLIYTAKQQIDYKNKAVDICILWESKKELVPGNYSVDVFADGQTIGTTTFTLVK